MYTLGVAKRIVAAYFHREKGYNFKRPEVVGWLKEMNPTLDVSQYNLPELTIHLASLLPPNPKIKPRTRRANAFKPTKSSHRGFKNTRPKSDHSVVTFGTPCLMVLKHWTKVTVLRLFLYLYKHHLTLHWFLQQHSIFPSIS
eukprot:TRINITY_DN7257_c0_g1_i2.p1 TRINITY_DN7257_c0_g1~~TRINITY_DN7257_c0_g1_i2.p1  ORF type:complete len:142 (+),score=7.52 TRINITY_DN7257_c0_g1_i2:16-441(+)